MKNPGDERQFRVISAFVRFWRRRFHARSSVGPTFEMLEDRTNPSFGYPILASETVAAGATGNGPTQIDFEALSANGRYLVFGSTASNLARNAFDQVGGPTDSTAQGCRAAVDARRCPNRPVSRATDRRRWL